MRILFCHWKGFPFGGGEIYLFKLFRLLLDEGHHIAFLTQADGRNRKMDGVAWYEIPPAPGVRNVKAQWEMVSAILARERPDVVHLHETFGFLGPWVLRKIINCYPAVTTIHFAGVLCPKGGRFSTETGICLRKISPNCIRCCTGLRSLKDMLLHTGWLIALQKAAVTLVGSRWLKSLCLENGFSPNRTHLLPPYWHEPVCGPATPHKNKDILFVGRIRKDKGVFDLLQALADLQNLDWRLVLAGKMDPEEQVEAYAAGMGLQNRLFFTGFVSHHKTGKYYRQSAFLVFPSHFPETFGIAGAEAMSSGIPVVAYDEAGVKDWLKHGINGLRVRKGDINGLRNAIKNMIEKPSLRKTMGRNAFEGMVKKYTLTSHLSKLFKQYEEAIHRA